MVSGLNHKVFKNFLERALPFSLNLPLEKVQSFNQKKSKTLPGKRIVCYIFAMSLKFY